MQWRLLPGSGTVHGLFNLYPYVLGALKTWRLAARNGTLYDWLENTDTSFQVVGAGLAVNLLRFIQYNDVAYVSDQSAALKRYVPGTGAGTSVLAGITQPVAPTLAPNVAPRTYAVLQDWTGAAPFGFTQSNSADFDITDGSATQPPPLGTQTATVRIRTTSAKGKTITSPAQNFALATNVIAFEIYASNKNNLVVVEISNSDTGENFYSPLSIQAPTAKQWYAVYIPVAGLPSFRRLRFRALQTPEQTQTVNFTRFVQPGQLQGQYTWVYTYYDGVGFRESNPSPVSNGGAITDFSVIPTNYQNEVFQGCAVLDFDISADSSVTLIRLYRSGGVPSLTTDFQGNPLYIRAAEILNLATTLNGAVVAGATTITLHAVSNAARSLQKGDWLVLDRGTAGTKEYVLVDHVTGFVVTLDASTPLQFNHANSGAVGPAYLDNNANSTLAANLGAGQVLDQYRGDPPAGSQWIARSADGRIWLAVWTDSNGSFHPAGIAVSNQPTVDRPQDQESFPDGVDPLTLRSPLLGFRFDVGGTGMGGESIVWFGFFQGLPTVLTRTALYRISAYSQLDWSPTAVVKLLETGCVAGDSVCEVNGRLFWVADRARVMSWDGHGPPTDIAHQRVNLRLAGVDPQFWGQWWARQVITADGTYYRLFFTPGGQTLPTQQLDFNTTTDAWEPCQYYAGNDASGALRPFTLGAVQSGPGDHQDLIAAHPTSGWLYRLDQSITDDAGLTATLLNADANAGAVTLHVASAPGIAPGTYVCLNRAGVTEENLLVTGVVGTTLTVTPALGFFHSGTGGSAESLRIVYPVSWSATTKKVGLSFWIISQSVIKCEQVFLQAQSSALDTVSLQVLTGGSEYGPLSFQYGPYSLAQAIAGEKELRQRVDFSAFGRWVQFRLTGASLTRAAVREVRWQVSSLRDGRITV